MQEVKVLYNERSSEPAVTTMVEKTTTNVEGRPFPSFQPKITRDGDNYPPR